MKRSVTSYDSSITNKIKSSFSIFTGKPNGTLSEIFLKETVIAKVIINVKVNFFRYKSFENMRDNLKR